MRITLIDGWQTFLRWWSFWLKLVASGVLLFADFFQHIITTWGILPHEFKQTIPDNWVHIVAAGLIATSFLAQLIRQRKAHAEAERSRIARDAAEQSAGSGDAEERGGR